jgi:hypothetical protein
MVSVASALIGLLVGFGVLTFVGFTYILLIDGLILLSIISGFAFGGFKMMKKVIK